MTDDKQWQEVGGRRVTPKIVDQQRAALIRLKKVLEDAVGKDLEKVAALREQLHRMRFGGGS